VETIIAGLKDARLLSGEILRIWQRISAGSCKAIPGGGDDDDLPMKMSKGPCHSNGHGTYSIWLLTSFGIPRWVSSMIHLKSFKNKMKIVLT